MEAFGGAGGGGAGGNDDFGMGAGGNDDREDYRSLTAVRNLRLKAVNMDFQRRELGEIIDYLRELTELPIYVKWSVLESAGISRRAADASPRVTVATDRSSVAASPWAGE